MNSTEFIAEKVRTEVSAVLREIGYLAGGTVTSDLGLLTSSMHTATGHEVITWRRDSQRKPIHGAAIRHIASGDWVFCVTYTQESAMRNKLHAALSELNEIAKLRERVAR